MEATATAPRAERSLAFPKLSRGSRRAVLLVHIIAGGAWIGIDVVLAVLVFTARATSSPDTEALCYRALDLFAIWPLFTAGMVSLASGIVLGLGSNYGLVRYWWVAIKLALNLILATLVLIALRPAVADGVEYGEAVAAGRPTTAKVDDLVFPPIVSPIALLVAFTLAVYKPWGRIRRASR